MQQFSIRRFLALFGFSALLLGMTACSNEQIYNSLQGGKESECQQIVDADERHRCLNNAHERYDEFKQRRDESRQK